MLGGVLVVLVAVAVATAVALEPRLALGGTTVEQDDRSALARAARAVSDRYAEADIVVSTPDGDLETHAREVGLEVDVEATVDGAATFEVGPIDRLRSLLEPVEVPVVARVDVERVEEVVAERDPTDRREPVEPSLDSDSGSISVRAGRAGEGLAADDVAAAVTDAASSGSVPIEAAAEPTTLPPRFSRADAEALADRARDLVREPLEVQAGTSVSEIPRETLASWVGSEPRDDGLELTLASEEVLDDLRALFDGAGESPVDARFTVEGDRPVIVRGRNGTRCCDAAAVPRVLDALAERPAEPVQVPMETVEPDRTSVDLEELRIVEPVGSFTTRYQAGQSRVVNIHRISDLMRGTLIGPGGRLSVNDKVGRRTVEKGFVSGGVIQDGVFTESIGGGISQFATTLFNAAFFGGLEIPEYQSHSIYISRYPYGREATLSFPKPDLVIANPTPHGVLVWPTYTSTSVTVTLYSTRWATGEQTGQSETEVGECTRVRTERTRTFVDGRTETDAFYATYRPEEGVRC